MTPNQHLSHWGQHIMRIDIQSKDRLGITQNILSVLSALQINLVATEVTKHHTFVHIQTEQLSFETISQSLLAIDGVTSVKTIELLPAEQRQQHLNVLLQRLPDATFDIDQQGKILLASHSGATICQQTPEQLEGKNISEFIAEPLHSYISKDAITIELNLKGRPYQADITPVISDHNLKGAILILRSPQRLGQQLSALQQSHDHPADNIIGHSVAIQSVMVKCQRFAPLDLPVLITGETGTGKELLAQALHQQGHDSEAPFLAINCATLPENLLESELFGYAPGAFSGAHRSGKPGLFELASGGTVFLDEIGEMSTYLQAKLLRFLQSYQFRRVGGTKEIKVKVRLISATHRNLEHMAQQNTFREDLFYRLNVLNIDIPPLRERATDIPLLVEHFITRAAAQLGQDIPTITPEAMTKLSHYSWPGNIRQLENLLFRTLALLDNNQLTEYDIKLPNQLNQPNTLNKRQENPTPVASQNNIENWQSAQQQFEIQLLTHLYPQYPSTRKLAKRLGVSHNKIAMKLKQYGIE